MSFVDDDWELASSSDAVRTVVLVGRTGNGKSATGNSILGREVFKSRASSSSVTNYCEKQTTVLNDGQIINVIDTPGFFDFSSGSEFVGKQIGRCIDLAKEGVHAFLVVFYVRTRFTEEEETTLRNLQTLFGSKIADYMIVVFTGGDELEEDDVTLDDYLDWECPKPLKEVLSMCGNRFVLFDNKTKDVKKQSEQVQQLVSFVDMVVSQNDGQPYTNELFTEMKKGETKLHKEQKEANSMKGCSEEDISKIQMQMQLAYDDQLKRIVETVESKFREATSRLEQQLVKEHAARLHEEQIARQAQWRSNREIQRLKAQIEMAHEGLVKQGENSHFMQKLKEHLEKEHEELCKYGEYSYLYLQKLKEYLARTLEELRKRGENSSLLQDIKEHLRMVHEDLCRGAENSCAIL